MTMKRSAYFSIPAQVGLRLQTALCLAALTAVSGSALAADEDANATADAGQLQTVTVTARYQQEDLQKTPIAISTTSAEQLKSANVASFARAPAVAIYVDDVYHATAVGSELGLTDIDRVEVDRGPQSTLSGNASIGGAIKLYTKQPMGDDSGFLTFTSGSYKEIGTTGAFDTTVAPNLFVRASGHFHRQDGYVNLLDFTCEMHKLGTPNLAGSFPTSQPDVAEHDCKTGEEGGGSEAGGRIKARWVPTDRLEVNLGFNIE